MKSFSCTVLISGWLCNIGRRTFLSLFTEGVFPLLLQDTSLSGAAGLMKNMSYDGCYWILAMWVDLEHDSFVETPRSCPWCMNSFARTGVWKK